MSRFFPYLISLRTYLVQNYDPSFDVRMVVNNRMKHIERSDDIFLCEMKKK